MKFNNANFNIYWGYLEQGRLTLRIKMTCIRAPSPNLFYLLMCLPVDGLIYNFAIKFPNITEKIELNLYNN